MALPCVTVKATHTYMYIAPYEYPYHKNSSQEGIIVELLMILPQVHLRKPCYDFSFL